MTTLQENKTEKALANVMPDGIIVLNADWQVLWWNQLAKEYFGLEGEKHRGLLIHRLLPRELSVQLTSGKRSLIEMYAPNQADLRVSIRLKDYGANERLLIIQDITKPFRLEGMRQDFVTNVSHELRTPLTVFHGYLEILLSQNGEVAEDTQSIFQHMLGQCERMERLVDDLSLLSRLESDKPDKKQHREMNVVKMLETICKDAKSLSAERNHQFHLDADENVPLVGQQDEIYSAFSNIIFNAVHYTPAEGRIDVRWYQDEEGKYFEVTDTGIGIPAKYIPRITQRFYRVDQARQQRRKGGTGLGLSIVKHVMLRHNATLSIKSKLHQGSVFTCTFN